MTQNHSIGISHLAYTLPKIKHSVQELASLNKITSPAAVMQDFGFGHCYLHDNEQTFDHLLIESGAQILGRPGVKSRDIEFLFLYSGVNQSIRAGDHALELFRYSVAKARHALQLDQTPASALSQQGCAGLLSTIHLAQRLLGDSAKNSVLCLAGDMLPPGCNREIMYNMMSDAAGAVLIEKHSPKNRIVHFYERIQPYYWDAQAHEVELLAAYFPMAHSAIRSCLEQAGLKISDIRWFVPHNVSLKSWEILAKLLSIPMDRIWTNNIERIGHTVSCDHIINLVEMEREHALERGDYLLLFTFGFGASWSCLLLQH